MQPLSLSACPNCISCFRPGNWVSSQNTIFLTELPSYFCIWHIRVFVSGQKVTWLTWSVTIPRPHAREVTEEFNQAWGNEGPFSSTVACLFIRVSNDMWYLKFSLVCTFSALVCSLFANALKLFSNLSFQFVSFLYFKSMKFYLR